MSNELEKFFSTPKEDLDEIIETFKVGEMENFDDKEIGVESPEFKTQEMNAIRISHGWHGSDYVWHISTKHPKIQFKVGQRDLLAVVAKTMNEVVPSNVEVKIWLPFADWDIQEYTFKAIDLKNCWQVSDKAIEGLNIKLFNALNTVV